MVTAIALPRKLRYGLLILVLAGATGGLLWASGRLPTSITERVASSFTDLLSANDVRGVDVTPENYAAIERFAHWQAAVEMARLSPWIGVGLGNYEAAYPTVRLLAWEFPLGHAHNYYLNVLGETGIIGLITYLGMWLIIIGTTWRARRHPDPLSSAAAAGLLGTWAYIAVHSLTDQLYVNSVFLHVGVLIGIVSLLARQTSHSSRLYL
jgi:O-antigen ligase